MSLFNRAADLFHRFHGYPPTRPADTPTLSIPKTQAVYVGELVAVVYKTREHKRPFFHRFNVKSRPLLLVSADGTQTYIVRGRYRFTARGFVG
jgi:hypothetical protein